MAVGGNILRKPTRWAPVSPTLTDAPSMWSDILCAYVLNESAGFARDLGPRRTNAEVVGAASWDLTPYGAGVLCPISPTGQNYIQPVNSLGSVRGRNAATVSILAYNSTAQGVAENRYLYSEMIPANTGSRISLSTPTTDASLRWGGRAADTDAFVTWVNGGILPIGWHRITASVHFGFARARLWIGEQKFEAATTGTAFTDVDPGGILFGGYRTGSPRPWDGTIADIRVWGRELRESEVEDIHLDPWAMYRRRRIATPSSAFEESLLAPNAVLASSNLKDTLGNSPPTRLADIDEDPNAGDGEWWTAVDTGLATDVSLSFLPPAALVGTQTYELLLRKTPGTPAPVRNIELLNNGSFVSTLLSGVSITSESGQVVQVSFAASAAPNPGIRIRPPP